MSQAHLSYNHLVRVFVQYVNYSNITLKGPSGAAGKNQTAVSDKAIAPDVEARINAEVLRCPECGRCSACTEKTSRRKLCKDRLEVRERLVAGICKIAPTGPDKSKKTSKKRKAEPAATSTKKASTTAVASKSPATAASKGTGAKKSPKLMMKKANGQLKPRITSNGNKRMAIPDELFPEFCQRIGARGTGERVNLLTQFVEDHPTISIRQVTIKFSEITVRDRPAWVPEPEKKQGRAFMFYLRPRFYKYLPDNERPADWEALAEEDERKWQEEKLREATDKKRKEEKMKDMMEGTESEDGTSTDADAGMPPTKKAKVSD